MTQRVVERAGRHGKGKRKLLGSHQRSWLWGRNLVLETLTAGNWPVVELWMADDFDARHAATVRSAAAALGLAVQVASAAALTGRCHSQEHQGLLARMGPFPYRGWMDLPPPAAEDLFLVLDRIQDPFNFGALLRSAEAFGVRAVVLGIREQVGVTSQVARSSSGAVARVPLVQTEDLAAALVRLRERGVAVWGTSVAGGVPLPQAACTGPVAFVIGNEGRGLADNLRALCTGLVHIPQSGAIGSLNAAAATAVLLYEVQRQRTAGWTASPERGCD